MNKLTKKLSVYMASIKFKKAIISILLGLIIAVILHLVPITSPVKYIIYVFLFAISFYFIDKISNKN